MQLGKGEEGLSRGGCRPPEPARFSRGAPPPEPPGKALAARIVSGSPFPT